MPPSMCSSCWKASAKFAPSSVVASTTPFAAIHDSASFSKSATGFREAESGLGFFAVDAQYALKGDRCLAKSVDFCKSVPLFLCRNRCRERTGAEKASGSISQF